MAEQAGLCLTWLQTPKDMFSHGVAQMIMMMITITIIIKNNHNNDNLFNMDNVFST